MRRKEVEPLEKRIINFFEGDFGRLQDLHPRLGASKVVRLLVRDHIKRAEEAARQRLPPVPATDNIDLKALEESKDE